jgi:hypothetical protein
LTVSMSTLTTSASVVAAISDTPPAVEDPARCQQHVEKSWPRRPRSAIAGVSHEALMNLRGRLSH